MLDTSNPLVRIGITAVVCAPPAIASTVYRLWIRRGRYWADDALALAAVTSQLLMFIGVFIHITESSPRGAMVASYYLMAATFYTVIWCSRLSILFSIIRIDPSVDRRRLLYCVAAVFFTVAVVLVSQLWWVCEPTGAAWKHEESPQCSLTRQVVILQLTTDVLSDLFLIIAPLRLLQGLKDKPLRRRLTMIFSTCIVTTVVSLVHAAFIVIHVGDKEVMAAIIENCFSLMVCNVPVVVTSLLAIRRAKSQANTSEPTDVQFASFPTNRRFSVVNLGTTFNTIGTGWANTLRWERDLRDLDQTRLSNTVDLHLSDLHDQTTTSTKDARVGHDDVDDDTQKQTWHLQATL